MRVKLVYRKEDTPEGKVRAMEYSRVKDAMILWDTQLSKIATYGALQRFEGWHWRTVKVLKGDDKK